jgi:hypothetical protein
MFIFVGSVEDEKELDEPNYNEDRIEEWLEDKIGEQ